MYFNSFPKEEYTIGNRTETVVDIFRKVAISQNNTGNIFVEELVQDFDNIESLAEKYYGDANLSWVIALTNNIVDPMTEFVLSTKNFDSLINTKYSGYIFYFEENVPLQQGDILIYLNPSGGTPYPDNTEPETIVPADLDSNKYCFVNSYNKEFRYCRVTNINGNFSAQDKVAAYRKIGDELQLITFTKKFTINATEGTYFVLPIKLKNEYKNSPSYIYNELNQVISPFRKYTSSTIQNDYVNVNANGIYTDPAGTDDNAFRDSILYNFIMNGSNISGLTTKTILQELSDKNEKYRKIKILSKDFVVPFIQTFNEMISTDDIRFRILSKET